MGRKHRPKQQTCGGSESKSRLPPVLASSPSSRLAVASRLQGKGQLGCMKVLHQAACYVCGPRCVWHDACIHRWPGICASSKQRCCLHHPHLWLMWCTGPCSSLKETSFWMASSATSISGGLRVSTASRRKHINSAAGQHDELPAAAFVSSSVKCRTPPQSRCNDKGAFNAHTTCKWDALKTVLHSARTSGCAVVQGSRARGCGLRPAPRKWPLHRAASSRGRGHGHVPRVCWVLSSLSRSLGCRQLAGTERQLELAIRTRLQADLHLLLPCCICLLRRADRLRYSWHRLSGLLRWRVCGLLRQRPGALHHQQRVQLVQQRLRAWL